MSLAWARHTKTILDPVKRPVGSALQQISAFIQHFAISPIERHREMTATVLICPEAQFRPGKDDLLGTFPSLHLEHTGFTG